MPYFFDPLGLDVFQRSRTLQNNDKSKSQNRGSPGIARGEVSTITEKQMRRTSAFA